MAVCAQCGASTPARVCPRCGGSTSPYAAPRPEAERPVPPRTTAGTTVRLPHLAGEGDVGGGRTGEATVVLPTTSAAAAAAAPRRAFVGRPAAPPAPAPPAPAPPWQARERSDAHAGARPPAQPPARQPAPVPAAAATGPSPAVAGPGLVAPAGPPVANGSTAPVRTSGPVTGRAGLLAGALVVLLLVLAGVVWFLTHRSGDIVDRPAPSKMVVELPAGASPCAESDAPDSGMQVYVGNTVTTCGFAQNVRSAVGSRRGTVTVEAYSPKTSRRYPVTCEGDPNLTCTGGNGAVVYLVPRSAQVRIAKAAAPKG